MCDTSNVPCDTLQATSEYDYPPPDTLRPETPLPDGSCTLRRTISYASIDTIRPSSARGIRRRINEIANGLKQKSTKKKKEYLSTHDVPKSAADDLASDSKPLESKAAKRGRKPGAAPLQDSSYRSVKESALANADKLHSGVPSAKDSSLKVLDCEFVPLLGEPPAEEDEKHSKDGLSTVILGPGACVATRDQDTFQSPRTSKLGIKDVQLDIRSSVSNITIWDGLQVAHHLFKCRLYLRCTTHPYDTVPVPDIDRIEMHCNTHPIRSRYARPPVLQTAYEGASPGLITSSGKLPKVNLAAGIHMDRFWHKILDNDGTWGWFRDAFVPLSPRLFDKMEYREFKLVSQVWLGEGCVEDELTFGIAMLLREVDMR